MAWRVFYHKVVPLGVSARPFQKGLTKHTKFNSFAVRHFMRMGRSIFMLQDKYSISALASPRWMVEGVRTNNIQVAQGQPYEKGMNEEYPIPEARSYGTDG